MERSNRKLRAEFTFDNFVVEHKLGGHNDKDSPMPCSGSFTIVQMTEIWDKERIMK